MPGSSHAVALEAAGLREQAPGAGAASSAGWAQEFRERHAQRPRTGHLAESFPLKRRTKHAKRAIAASRAWDNQLFCFQRIPKPFAGDFGHETDTNGRERGGDDKNGTFPTKGIKK